MDLAPFLAGDLARLLTLDDSTAVAAAAAAAAAAATPVRSTWMTTRFGSVSDDDTEALADSCGGGRPLAVAAPLDGDVCDDGAGESGAPSLNGT